MNGTLIYESFDCSIPIRILGRTTIILAEHLLYYGRTPILLIQCLVFRVLAAIFGHNVFHLGYNLHVIVGI